MMLLVNIYMLNNRGELLVSAYMSSNGELSVNAYMLSVGEIVVNCLCEHMHCC